MTDKRELDVSSILLEGELTLPRAAELKEALSNALAAADGVTVKFGEVEAVDLSFLQLLCSLHRSALKLDKQLRFEGDIPNAFNVAADEAGFTRLMGCGRGNEGNCLWAKKRRDVYNAGPLRS